MFRDLPGLNWLFIWVVKYYPWLTPGSVPPLVAARGLGVRGCFVIPANIWASLVPSGLPADLRDTDLSTHEWVRPPNPEARRMLQALLA